MAAKTGGKLKNVYSNMRLTVLITIILLVFMIVTVAMLSSGAFYVSMIESITISGFREASHDLNECDFSDEDLYNEIKKIEKKYDILLEIYAKDGDDKYEEVLYAKQVYDAFTGSNELENSSQSAIGYTVNEFEVLHTYSDGSKVGTLLNKDREYNYFLMEQVSEDTNHLFILAVHYDLIESEAKAISYTVLAVTAIILVIVVIAVWIYLRRIIKPLNNIYKATQIMSAGKDKTIRIPRRYKHFINEIDMVMSGINSMYESLILTQEELEEKSEILASELELRDIEQKSREELIADSSHELKTPISIIQGYAEGIEYILDDREAVKEYCETIIEECNRMTDLVVSMMSLSDIRHNMNKLKYGRFSIKDFIERRLLLHQKIFEKNQIRVTNMITDDIYGYGDETKLQFVINNLLSNAISYIGDNDRVIRVRYERIGMIYRIFVFNSGDGLSQETLEKLWMSFYRADTARNRSEGHFGLGLSIIKAVQDAHSQQCGVDNAEGGVEFWFDIAVDTTE